MTNQRPPAFLAFLFLSGFLGVEAAAASPSFVGARVCLGCHAALPGNHFQHWKGSRHAQAMAPLKGKERTDPACLSCHSTGAGGDGMDGVQCEACHGPGSEYARQEVMKDKAAAIQKGLTPAPGKVVCQGCHK